MIQWNNLAGKSGTLHVTVIADALSLPPTDVCEWMQMQGYDHTWGAHCDGPRYTIEAAARLERLVRIGRSLARMT